MDYEPAPLMAYTKGIKSHIIPPHFPLLACFCTLKWPCACLGINECCRDFCYNLIGVAPLLIHIDDFIKYTCNEHTISYDYEIIKSFHLVLLKCIIVPSHAIGKN